MARVPSLVRRWCSDAAGLPPLKLLCAAALGVTHPAACDAALLPPGELCTLSSSDVRPLKGEAATAKNFDGDARFLAADTGKAGCCCGGESASSSLSASLALFELTAHASKRGRKKTHGLVGSSLQARRPSRHCCHPASAGGSACSLQQEVLACGRLPAPG